MKYAVPISAGKLSAHFGHCEQFAIFEVEPATHSITAKSLLIPPPHTPGAYPNWLAGQGVSVILCGGMGNHARDLFIQNGIEVVTGVMEADPQKAVTNHLKGELETGADACDHDSSGHVCQH